MEQSRGETQHVKSLSRCEPVATWSPLWRPGAWSAGSSSLLTHNISYSRGLLLGSNPVCAEAAGPVETLRAWMLSPGPQGETRAPLLPAKWPGSSGSAYLSCTKAAKLPPRLSRTFPADNLRTAFPKPKLGHVLCQRILSMAECIYLKVLIKE